MKEAFRRLSIALHAEGKLRDFLRYCFTTLPFEDPSKRRPIFIMSEAGSGSTWIAGMLGHLPHHVYIHELKIIREHGVVGHVSRALATSAWALNERMLFALFEAFHQARLWTIRSHSKHMKNRPELLSPKNLGDFKPDEPNETHVDVINSTGPNIQIAPLLRRAYPDAILCYLVRDPRDTVASARYRKPFGNKASVEEWARCYVRHWEMFKQHRETARIDLLRYEAWLDDAERELRDFLARNSLWMSDEEIASAVFEHSAAAINAGQTPPVGNLGQAKPGGWRDTLTTEDVRRIRPILENVTLELGYGGPENGW